MAGPSAQDIQEQVRQAQQNALAQQAAQHPPQYPMGGGGGYMPPPPILPQNPIPLSSIPPKGTIINLGKISLFMICISLISFGIFIFLGGFLLGMWLAASEPVSLASRKKEVPLLGLIPSEQQVSGQQVISLPSQEGEPAAMLREKAGSLTEDIVSNATVPNVPTFLYPLVTATQSAVGKQLGHKVQQQVDRRANQQVPTPAQPQTKSPLNQQMQLPYQQSSQLPPSGATHPPAGVQQGGQTSASQQLNSPSYAKDETYTIQVGVYAAKDNAYALVNRMQALNYTSHIVEAKAPDGSTLYYVHSGLYNDYNAALEAASQFAMQNIPGAIVVKISKSEKGVS